jgi:hypothetical protein
MNFDLSFIIIYFSLIFLFLYAVKNELRDLKKRLNYVYLLKNQNFDVENKNDCLYWLDFFLIDYFFIVEWRTLYILSFISIFLIYLVTFRRIPNQWELLIGIFVIYFVFTAITRFSSYHLSQQYKLIIEYLFEKLKSKNDDDEDIEKEKISRHFKLFYD